MKIALAGVESHTNYKLIQQVNPPTVLLTHFYFRNASPERVEKVLKELREKNTWIIVDSGAYSFQVKYMILDDRDSFSKVKKEVMERNAKRMNDKRLYEDREYAQECFNKEFAEYLRKWLEYLPLYYKYADMIAEIDIDNHLGMERMWEVRELYKDYKDKIVYTPHAGLVELASEETPEKVAYMERLFDSGINYMGLGLTSDDRLNYIFQRYLPEFKKHGVKIHGWAQTKEKHINQFPYFSVDSTTWLMGAQYGCTYEFKPGWTKIKTFTPDSKGTRIRFKEEVIALGIDYDAFITDEGRGSEGLTVEENKIKNNAVNLWNAHQWANFSREKEKDISKNYWLSEDEKEEQIGDAREEVGMNNLIVRKPLQSPSMELGVYRLCNACTMSSTCPHWEKGATCVFSDKPIDLNKMSSAEALNCLAEMQLARVTTSIRIEKSGGGHIDPNTTKEIKLAGDLLAKKAELGKKGNSISISADGDGGMDIISKLFGAKPAEKAPEPEPIYTDATIVKD